MKAKEEKREYPEIEGCEYITQHDEVTIEAGERAERYITHTLYRRNNGSFFIKTRRWTPWWGTEPEDLGDEALPNAEAALAWAVDVAGLNPQVATRLIVGVDEQ